MHEFAEGAAWSESFLDNTRAAILRNEHATALMLLGQAEAISHASAPANLISDAHHSSLVQACSDLLHVESMAFVMQQAMIMADIPHLQLQLDVMTAMVVKAYTTLDEAGCSVERDTTAITGLQKPMTASAPVAEQKGNRRKLTLQSEADDALGGSDARTPGLILDDIESAVAVGIGTALDALIEHLDAEGADASPVLQLVRNELQLHVEGVEALLTEARS